MSEAVAAAMEAFIWSLLVYVVYPTWLLLGVLDFAAHQHTDIAATSGVRESALHVLQMVQNGVPVLIVLFLEINALTLAVMAVFVLIHTLTAYVDINYTHTRREIGPPEQLVHALMISWPILAWVLLLLIGRANPESLNTWSLQLREQPWDIAVILAVLSGATLFSGAPAMAELLQTWRAARRAAA